MPRGRPFEKGKPRYPNSGRRAGTPNKSSERAKRLIAEGDDAAIVRQTVANAKVGDVASQALYYRFLRPPTPKPKYIDRPVDLKPVANAKEALAQLAEIVVRVSTGELDLEGSQALVEGLKAFITAYSAVELEDEVMKAKLRDGEI
jgi:hypothetical protein